MVLPLTLSVLFTLSSVQAETIGSVEESAASPSLPPQTVGKIACNDLLANVLKEYELGEIDLGSKKVKGSAESRVRVSERNGIYLIAAAKQNKPGPLKVIYPALKADGVELPAIHGTTLTPRIRSMALGNAFEIEMRTPKLFKITAVVGGKMSNGQTSCTVKNVRTHVVERDLEEEAKARQVQESQDMKADDEPIYKSAEQTLNADGCRKFKSQMEDHPENHLISNMCKFLDKTF